MSENAYGSVPSAAQAPACKNHPNVPTFVRCQRCGEPVCPQCMRTAVVGVQCPQCVNEGAKNVRQPTTITGAKRVTGRPYITYTMIALCVVAFVAQQALGWSDFTSKYVFAPVVGAEEPWRFITSAFLHSQGAIYHILFNMAALWAVGSQLEYVLGRWRFITLYLLSAVGGSVAVLLLADPMGDAWVTGVLGASGAIFGLFGALLSVTRKTGQSMQSIYVLIGINLAIGFFVPNISWQGHLGGLVVGAILGAIYIHSPREKRTLYSIGGSVLVAVALVALAVVKYSQVNPLLW